MQMWFRVHSWCTKSLRTSPFKIAGSCSDLAGQSGRAGQGGKSLSANFFQLKKNLRRGIKFRFAKSRAIDHRDLYTGDLYGGWERKVTPTKIVLVLLLLASAITAAFANPPGGSYIQCDPKNPRSPVRCTPDGW
jgi:hypothetical protein